MTTIPRAALWIVLSLTACGDNQGAPDARGDDGDAAGDAHTPTTPTVISTIPGSGGSLALNATVRATFSEAMDRATLTASTFTVTTGSPGTPVAGTVTYTSSGAKFRPAANLPSNSSFTATITTGATSSHGVALAMNKTWSFTTATALASAEPVDLGSADNFAILSKSGISSVPTSVVTGDLGVSPIDSTAITGFSLTAFSTNVYATSTQVTGRVYAANYAAPTPINLTTAIGDMETAFTDAASRAPTVTELGAGDIGGLDLAPGVYKWSSGLLIPTNVMLSGSATDVWVFEIAQDLTVSSGARVMLAGGAVPKNVFWQVSGHVTLNTGSHVEGNLMSQTSTILGSGASLNGRLLAQTAVTLDAATVVRPAL
jgi:hypothetical protein